MCDIEVKLGGSEMNKTKAAKAVALQVKECGCSHCIHLVEKALGKNTLISEFLKEVNDGYPNHHSGKRDKAESTKGGRDRSCVT